VVLYQVITPWGLPDCRADPSSGVRKGQKCHKPTGCGCRTARGNSRGLH
jgi:hypothetical protein